MDWMDWMDSMDWMDRLRRAPGGRLWRAAGGWVRLGLPGLPGLGGSANIPLDDLLLIDPLPGVASPLAALNSDWTGQ